MCVCNFQESDSKIQTLQADIGKAEQQRQLDSKAKAEEAERVKKEKEKHEKLRKELEAQRLRYVQQHFSLFVEVHLRIHMSG